MNERIKELANKAGRFQHYSSDIMLIYGDEDIQKFAELIIQECVNAIRDELLDFENGNCFGGENGKKLWESVTSEYELPIHDHKRVLGRMFNPYKLGKHLENVIKSYFGVEQ